MPSGMTRTLPGLVGIAGLVLGFAGPVAAEGIPAPDGATLKAQWEVYEGGSVPSTVEFAPMRATQTAALGDGDTLRLVSLHPGVNRWYLLQKVSADGRAENWHFENADAARRHISLTESANPALLIEGAGEARECRPWEGEAPELAGAAQSGLPYAPVCGGRLYLRNQVSGSKTNREAVSDFLRTNVMFGDKLVNLIKGTFFEDAFLESASFGAQTDDSGDVVAALGKARLDRRPVMRTAMGLPVEGAPDGMEAGSWYKVEEQDGIFASVMQPGLIAADITGERNGASWLDGIEQTADVYLVAFDLTRFDVGYELGTDHPGLGWSSRPQRQGADWNLAGPDGFSRAAPLVRNGMLSPALTARVAGAIAGGFKRDHGAFRFSNYASFNRGHHYGFISNGVTFSRLIENLATLYVTVDGEVGMKTWTKADDAMIPRLAHARQNGVSVVERDPETGASVPGPLVTSWGGGNWSGSADAELRTLRSGACLRESGGRKFLIYAYFSSVTPSAMARVFQAYDCDYGMLLDMNSPELTYMAVYRQNASGDGLLADHLSRFMAESDPWLNGGQVPRFVNFSDNRDFIYLFRKD